MKVDVYSRGILIKRTESDNVNKIVMRSGCGKCVMYQDESGNMVLGFKHKVYSRVNGSTLVNSNRFIR
jgi:hypothetical protein